jgi:peptidylprolyl isomerase
VIRLIAFLAVLIAVAPAAAAPPQLPGGVDPQNTIVIDTTQGQIIIKLRPDLAQQGSKLIGAAAGGEC